MMYICHMANFRISILQYDQKWRDKDANFQQIEALLTNGDIGSICVLPELFQTGFCVSDVEEAEYMDGSSINKLQFLAKKFKTKFAGSLLIREEDNVFNRFVVLGESGVEAYYDKVHLFGLSNEHEYISPGKQKVDFILNGYRFRIIICYDLRFPYLSFNDTDYDALLICANWPVQRIAHWDALLKSRAIENQSYVVGVNRVGVDPEGNQYPGHSSVYDARGTQILRFIGHEMRTVTLDFEAQKEYRLKHPFIKDRTEL